MCNLRIIGFIFLFFHGYWLIPLNAQQAVPLWGIFEVEFMNNKSYGDPFREVSMEVRYINPDRDTILFQGFYNGGNMWKARYMPNQTGRWEYKAWFSDGTPAGSGSFNVVPSPLPGLIGPNVVNSTWFGFQSSAHEVIRGFHVGDRFFASNWQEEERKAFLDYIESQGYNLLSVASFMLNREVEGRGKGWVTPDLWDGNSRLPLPTEYDRAETILNDLSERQIIVYPFAGFFGQASDFPLDYGDQELYLRYTIARWGPYWNLLFNVAGPEPLLKPDAFRNQMSLGDVIRLGTLIKKLDPFGHPVSVHNKTGSDPFRHESWCDYITLQGGKEGPGYSVYQYIEKNARLNKPVFAQEVFWPGNMYHKCHCEDPVTIREKAFTLLFAGATINFADMDGNSSSGFSGSLDLEDRHQVWHDAIRGAWDWLESVPFYRMKPRRDLGNNGYVLAEEGISYAVYIPDGGKKVQLDLSNARGSFNLRWYNPESMEYSKEAQVVDAGQTIVLGSPPGDPSHDWIAMLERNDPPIFSISRGKVVMEAEHAVASQGWNEVQGVSSKAMRDDGVRGSGFLDFPVTFDSAGRYYVYMLMRRTNEQDAGKANDAYVTLGGRELFASDGVTRPEGIRCSKMEFTWESMPKGPGNHTPRHIFHDPVYVEVPAPDTYTFRIGSRSQGFEVDKIVLTVVRGIPEL
jgi:hypothetical protein